MPDEGSKTVPPNSDALKAMFVWIVGSDRVADDAARLDLHGQDIWSTGVSPPALIVAPRSLDEVSRVVRAATDAGLAIAPRGAGMSYTGGYVPAVEGTISLDMSGMNRVLEIRPDDMVVTVEAGCGWRDLNAALAPLNLRTPFWGPMSGLVSTIGGGLSQLNAMFGAGHYGTSSESVVALTVVLADGSILHGRARRRWQHPVLSPLRPRSGRIVLRRLRRVRHQGRDQPAAHARSRA